MLKYQLALEVEQQAWVRAGESALAAWLVRLAWRPDCPAAIAEQAVEQESARNRLTLPRRQE